MTDKHTTEYLEKLRNIRLSSSTKERMRDELGAFADFHSVRVVDEGRSIGVVQMNSVFALFTHSKTRIMKATLLIALLIGTGGTSFAAQGAVPGEFLYPVKISVNENIKSAFAVNADAQAKFQAKLLAERLEEAQKLAAKGKLEGKLEGEVRANVNAQLEKTLAASTEASAVTEVAVRTEVSNTLASFRNELAILQLNSDITTNILASYSTAVSPRNSSALASQMNTDPSMAMSVEMDAPSTMSMKVAADADVSTASLIENAQVRIDGLTSILKNAVELSVDVKTEMEAQLKVAVKHIADANASLRANAEAQARTQTESALEVIGIIESELSALGEVKIDAETGSIIDFNLNANGSTGGGTSGNSGSGIYLDGGAAVEGSGEASLEGDMIDTVIDSNGTTETGGSFGF